MERLEVIREGLSQVENQLGELKWGKVERARSKRARPAGLRPTKSPGRTIGSGYWSLWM